MQKSSDRVISKNMTFEKDFFYQISSERADCLLLESLFKWGGGLQNRQCRSWS